MCVNASFKRPCRRIQRGYRGAAKDIGTVTHVRNKNSNMQGRSSFVVNVNGRKFFPLREVPILKRDAIGREPLLDPVASLSIYLSIFLYT